MRAEKETAFSKRRNVFSKVGETFPHVPINYANAGWLLIYTYIQRFSAVATTAAENTERKTEAAEVLADRPDRLQIKPEKI